MNNRKILLVINIERITGCIDKFRNKRLKTGELPLKISDIKIFTLDSLRLLKENINFGEFYEDLYKLIKFKDSHLVNSEMHFDSFMHFLIRIGHEGIAKFLEESEKDKEAIERNFEFENQKKYYKFFDTKKGNPNYIHVPREEYECYDKQVEISKSTLNVHLIRFLLNYVDNLLKKNIFHLYLEEEGDSYLPSAIDYLAKIGTNDLGPNNEFVITFLKPGIPSLFKIVSLEFFTKQSKRNIKGDRERNKSTIRIESIEGFDDIEGNFKLKGVGEELVKLGTRSITNLIMFFKKEKSENLNEFKLNENLVYSLRNNHDYFKIHDRKRKKKRKMIVDINIDEIDFQIIENSPIYKNIMILCLQMKYLGVQTIDFPDDIKKCFYDTFKITLNYLSLNFTMRSIPGYFVENLNRSNFKQLFETSILLIINKLIFKSHPFYPNNQILAYIPFLSINFSDEWIPIFQLQNYLKQANQIFKDTSSPSNRKKQKRTKKVIVAKKDSILVEELRYLLKDHKKMDSRKKNCKHCIIKFKKSIFNLQFIFGSYTQYIANCPSIYVELLNIQKGEIDKINNYGIKIDISCISLKENIYEEIQLAIPFLVLTKDVGYFKNDFSIVMSSSSQDDIDNLRETRRLLEDNQKLLTCIGIIPGFKIDSDLLKSLFSDHFMFLRKSEKKILEKEIEKSKKSVHISKKAYDSTGLFLLMFKKQIKQKKLLRMFDTSMKECHFKQKLYFGIQNISIDLRNSQLSSIPFAISKNISYFMKIIENTKDLLFDGVKKMTGIVNTIMDMNEKKKKFSFLQTIENFSNNFNALVFVESLECELTLSNDLAKYITCEIVNFLFDNGYCTKSGEMHCKLDKTEIKFSGETHLTLQDLIINRNKNDIILGVRKINLENKNGYLFRQNFENRNSLNLTFKFLQNSYSIEMDLSEFSMKLSNDFLYEMLLTINILRSYVETYHDKYKSQLFTDYFDRVKYELYVTNDPFEQILKKEQIVKGNDLIICLKLKEFIIQIQEGNFVFFEIFGKDFEIYNQNSETQIEGSIFEARSTEAEGKPQIYFKLFELKNSTENFTIEIKDNLNGPRVIKSQNLKITFVNKYIQEVLTFFTNLFNEIEVESIYTVQSNEEIIKKTLEEIELNRTINQNDALIRQKETIIHLDDCQIIIPSSSKERNKLEIFFDNLTILKKLVKKEVNLPSSTMELIFHEGKGLINEVFQNQDFNSAEIVTQYFKINFENIGIHSIIEGNKIFLLRLNDVSIDMYQGIKRFLKDENWQFNQIAEVNFKTLNLMDIDEVNIFLIQKKLDFIQKFIETNLKEESSIFKIGETKFKRTDLAIEIEKLELIQENYIFEEISQYFDSSSNNEVDESDFEEEKN